MSEDREYAVNTWLFDAVHEEVLDMKAAQEALGAGADVNSKDLQGGNTPLMWAARSNHVGLIRLLLERGANVNARNDQGSTALLEAAAYSSTRIIRLLLRRGADLHARDNTGRTALHYASYDAPKAILFLLKVGAHIEARDDEGKTPLLEAAHWSRYRTVRTLLRRGADITARSDNGYSALRWHYQPPPGKKGITEQQWRDQNRLNPDEVPRAAGVPPDNSFDRFCSWASRVFGPVFDIPYHEYAALEKLLVDAGATLV